MAAKRAAQSTLSNFVASKKSKTVSPVNHISLPVDSSLYNLKIVTYNVNGIRACNGNLHGGIPQFVEENNADVYCFQEVKCTSDAIPFPTPENYHLYFATGVKKGYSGTMILTKTKPMSELPKLDYDVDGRVIALEFSTYYLVNCYVPNSGQKLEKLDYRAKTWDKLFFETLNSLSKTKPVILVGDLNVARYDIDVYDPVKLKNKAAGFTDVERASFEKLLESGFVDAWSVKHPNEAGYTYYSHMRESFKNNRGWRLDYFVLSNSLKDCIVDTYPMKDTDTHPKRGSDHIPACIYLKM